jgi:uncharacterized protein (DUF433 family)
LHLPVQNEPQAGLNMSVVTLARRTGGDPLAGGFFTVREAARLLEIPSPQKITAWLRGHKNSDKGPIIRRQYEPVANVQELGFWDLLEVRFVDHFRKQGVSLQALRRAAATAREVLHQDHPFATSNVKFLTDRRAVFLQVAKEEGDRTLLNLMTRQFAMYEVIEEVLAKGISFDDAGLAKRWAPKPKEFPAVALDPLIASGQPAIVEARVPTRALYDLWRAEDGRFSVVSDWFEVEERLVREAVEFELGLPN